MKTYSPRYSGKDLEILEEFRRIAEVLSTAELMIPVHYSEPNRPRLGRFVVADGVEWDPLALGVPHLVWWNGTIWVAP